MILLHSTKNQCKILSPKSNCLHLSFILMFFRIINSEFYGSNQIVNGDFQDSYTSNYKLYPLQIQGWTCTKYCEIDNCKTLSVAKAVFANCTGLVLDLNSANQNQVVTQIMQLTVGRYLLEFQYNYPFSNAQYKTFLVYFNNQLILAVSPQTFRLFQSFLFSQYVIPVDGNNNLTFTMAGPPADGIGFKIGNISLRQALNETVLTLQNVILNNSIISAIVSLPASRVLLHNLLNWLVCFDRLQFYYYHKRNHSSNALVMLSSVSYLMNHKGSLVYDNLGNVFDPIFGFVNPFLVKTNFKLNYAQPQFLNKNTNGFGFLINNGAVFMYSLPIGLFLSIISILIVKKVNRNYVFKLMAQFTLLGILLNILCEGNVEQYTFYAFAQFKTFFCFTYRNKLQSVFLAFFYFVVLSSSVGSIFWFKYHYKSNARLLIQEYRTKLRGLCICAVDKGVICLIFGAIHQLLIDSPNTQLISLFATEVVWLSVKVYFFCNKVYVNKELALLGFVEGILRMTFQVVSYVYSNYENIKFQINSTIMPILICCFIANWLLQLTVSIACLIILIKKKIIRKINNGKVVPLARLIQHTYQIPKHVKRSKYKKDLRWVEQVKKGLKNHKVTVADLNYKKEMTKSNKTKRFEDDKTMNPNNQKTSQQHTY